MPTPFDYDVCMKEHDGYAVTRDGRKVKLLTKEYPGNGKRVVLCNIDGYAHSFPTNGVWGEGITYTSLNDLFTPDKPKKAFHHERWANVYPSEVVFHPTEAAAKEYRTSTATATVKVVVEGFEGDGLWAYPYNNTTQPNTCRPLVFPTSFM